MEPAEFLAYRDAVRRAAHAFDHAEQTARRGGQQPSVEGGDAWSRVASDLAETAQRALSRSMESMGRAAAKSWSDRNARRTAKSDPDAARPGRTTGEAPKNGPVWPPPARDRPRPPAS